MKKSIDKCAGEECICKRIFFGKEMVELKGIRIESISFDNGPSIFPGGGIQSVRISQTFNPAIAMEVERQRQVRLGIIR